MRQPIRVTFGNELPFCSCISQRPFHTEHMQSIRTLHVLLIAVWSLTSNAAPFPGGGDALVNEARVWVSQETGYPSAAIEMSAPDRRVPVESCETPLEFRFPFQGNQRTVEAVCNRPTWKRFIRVKIDEKNRAVATTQALTAGHTLAISDLRLIPYSGLTAEIHDDPQRLIGLTLRDSLDANTVIKRQMVIQEMAVFVTDRAYEAGELIERANLKRMETETPPANSLSAWPSGVIIASRYIEPGQTLLDSDIEQSEYVVISSTNIIRGQVITQAMVERTLQPKNKWVHRHCQHLKKPSVLRPRARYGQGHQSQYLISQLPISCEKVKTSH